MSKRFLCVTALALVPGGALAQATPQGAADLTALFQTYLGTTPGVVNVVADGDAYAVTLDAGPFVAMIPAEAGATVTMSPMTMRLTDNGDGTWAVVQKQAFSLTMSIPGEIEMDMSVADLSCTGVFDVAMKGFARQDCRIEGVSLFQEETAPDVGGTSVSDMKLESMTIAATSVPGEAGGIDSELTYTTTGLTQTISEPLGEGMAPIEIGFSLTESRDTGTVKGLRNHALLAAVAWVVANPDEGAMMANRGALKAILSDGLPLWEDISVSGTGSGVAITTPLGPVTAASLGYDVALSGAVAQGRLAYGIRLDGLELAPGMLPPFAEPLVPASLAISFGVEGYDGAAAAQTILGLFDLAPGAEPGPEFEDALLQALLPQGTVDLVLAPGSVANATYRLGFEGRMQVGPNMMMPTGTAKITATGYDAAVAALDAAPDEVKMDLLPALGIARQFAQDQGDGTLVWDIDASVPGSFKVNGMDLMGMQ